MVIKKRSFTQRVKTEIILNWPHCQNQIKKELMLLINLSNNINFDNKKNFLTMEMENTHSANYFLKLYDLLFDVKKNPHLLKKDPFKKQLVVFLEENFLSYINKISLSSFLKKQDNFFLVAKICFLLFGNINSPQTNFYHLEFVFHDFKKAQSLILIMEKKFSAKLTKRRKMWIIYIKKAEHISNFLRFLNANSSLLEFENVRIERDFLNSINRIHNMDLANLEKTIKASSRVNSMIQQIYQTPFWSKLGLKQQRICLIRLKNPNFTLQDICDFYNQKYNDIISKSMVNHTFRKIKENQIYKNEKK